MSMAQFTDAELAELRDAFALFDKDGNGSISREEMIRVMAGFGQHVEPRELGPLFNEADDNADGVLSFEEFTGLVQTLDPEKAGHEHVHRALVIFLEIRGR